MFATLTEEMVKVPQSDEIQHLQLEKIVRLYETLLQVSPHESSLRHDLALGLNRLGEIHHRLGLVADSQQTWRRSCELLWQLIANAPEETDYRKTLAQNLDYQFHLFLHDVGRPCSAEYLVRQRMDLLRELIGDLAGDLDSQRQLALALTAYGELLSQSGRMSAATDQLLQALELWRRISEKSADPWRDAPQMARTHQRLGTVQMQQCEWDRAAGQLGEALRLQQWAAKNSEPKYQNDLRRLTRFWLDCSVELCLLARRGSSG